MVENQPFIQINPLLSGDRRARVYGLRKSPEPKIGATSLESEGGRCRLTSFFVAQTGRP